MQSVDSRAAQQALVDDRNRERERKKRKKKKSLASTPP